jgi:hypothetical protein
MNAVPLLREVVRQLAPDKQKQMISAAEHYIAQGLAQGVETGRLRGLRSDLTRVLVKRFGALTPALEASIAAADAKTLDQWFDRAIDSPTLDAVTR